MKKLAACLLLASTTEVALAELDHTPEIYGRVRLALQDTDQKGRDVDDFASYLGVRGKSESLIEGVTISYRGEWDFKEEGINDAHAFGRARLFWGAISGDFGTVKIGQAWSPYWLKSVKHVQAAFQSKQIHLAIASPAILPRRRGNSVSYISPAYYGLQASVMLQTDSNNETNQEETDEAQVGLSYNIGNLNLGFAFLDEGIRDDANKWSLSASYQFDQLKFGALYSEIGENGSSVGSTEAKTNPWSVMTAYTFGLNTLLATYYDDDGAQAKTEGTGWGIELQRKIGPKTKLYTSYGDNGFKNKGSVISFGFSINF